MIDEQKYMDYDIKENEWKNAECDKYDYMTAGFCGGIAGLIDVIFVNSPMNSKLGKVTDKATDEVVKKIAKFAGWKPEERNKDNVASAIGFFEKKYKVNYDQRHTSDVDGAFKMATKNHHFKSIAHSPDPIGLFFSILDQFTNKASFFSDGQLIRVDTSDADSPLKGNNFVAKLFSGFCNWIGHIISDVAGSSGNRGPKSKGRGSGVAIPFMELFQLCDFGNFTVGKDKQTLAVIMTRVFQEGYDLRFGAAMAIPVLVEELMIRTIWVIRQRFYKKKEWKECIPSKKHADLRIMLIVGNSTLCLIDGTDATIRGLVKGGNVVTFILHLNYVAWVRLVMLVLRELQIRFGVILLEVIREFTESIMCYSTPQERMRIQEFYNRIEKVDISLDIMLREFTIQVEEEYKLINSEIEESFLEENSLKERAEHSVNLAKLYNVDDSKIMKSDEDLDDFFS